MPIEKKRQRQSRIRHEPGESGVFDCKEVKDHGKENYLADSTIAHIQPGHHEAKANINERKNGAAKLDLKKKYPPNGSTQIQKDVVSGKKNLARREVTATVKISQDKKRDTIRTNTVSFVEDGEYEPVTIMKSSSDAMNETSCPQKYRRREVTTNWLRYEELPLEDEVEVGEDYMLGEDFSKVLNLQGNTSTCGYLHLKEERSWGDMSSSDFGSYGLGALNVADLVSALATIPFHHQLKIPEESLPAHDIYMYTKDADAHKKTYTFDKKYVTDIAINEAFLENLKLRETDTIQLTSEVQDSKDTSDCSKADSLNISSLSTALPVDFDSRKSSKEAVGAEILETKLGNFSKDVTQPCKSISNKETNYDIPILKPDSVGVLNSNIFNFGLPQRCSEAKPAVTLPSESLVKKSLLNKSSDESNFDSSVMKLIDDEQKVNGDDKTKVITDLGEIQSKLKEPVILVSKTEIENLEDWLDSVLDD